MIRIFTITLLLLFVSCSDDTPGEKFTNPLGFPLIDTSIDDIQLVLGPASIVEEEHHVEVICYILPDSGVSLTFWAQGEGLSGGFSIQTIDSSMTDDCSTISDHIPDSSDLSVGGIRLGISKQTLKRLLEHESVEEGDSIRAHYERIETVDHPTWGATPLHIDIYVTGYFIDNKLIKLSIGKSAST